MAFQIHADFQPALLLQRLDRGEKRLAYAAVNAIDKTLKKAQQAVREHVRDRMTLRSKEKFILQQAAVIDPFPSVRDARPYGEISIGHKKRLLLSRYEEGGPRPLAVEGRKSAAVPIPGGPARPTPASDVPVEFRFSKLRLRVTPRREGARRRKRGGQEPVRYGLHDTYQVPGVGVFQRTTKDESRPVYIFEEDEQLPDEIDFVDVVRRTSDEHFAAYLEEEVESTLARRGLTRSSFA